MKELCPVCCEKLSNDRVKEHLITEHPAHAMRALLASDVLRTVLDRTVAKRLYRISSGDAIIVPIGSHVSRGEIRNISDKNSGFCSKM